MLKLDRINKNFTSTEKKIFILKRGKGREYRIEVGNLLFMSL